MTKVYYVLFTFMMVTFFSCFSQKKTAAVAINTDLSEINIDTILSTLNKRNIDTVFVYKIGCSGCIWKTKGLTFIFYQDEYIYASNHNNLLYYSNYPKNFRGY